MRLQWSKIYGFYSWGTRLESMLMYSFRSCFLFVCLLCIRWQDKTIVSSPWPHTSPPKAYSSLNGYSDLFFKDHCLRVHLLGGDITEDVRVGDAGGIGARCWRWIRSGSSRWGTTVGKSLLKAVLDNGESDWVSAKKVPQLGYRTVSKFVVTTAIFPPCN